MPSDFQISLQPRFLKVHSFQFINLLLCFLKLSNQPCLSIKQILKLVSNLTLLTLCRHQLFQQIFERINYQISSIKIDIVMLKQIVLSKLHCRLGERPMFLFCKHKNLKKHIKKQKQHKQISKQRQGSENTQQQLYFKFVKIKFRSILLFLAYIPLSMPMLLNIFEAFTLQFLFGVNILQYYSTVHMCYDSYKQIEQQKNKAWRLFIPFCISAVALNFIPGYYSILSPIGLMALSISSNYLKKNRQQQDPVQDLLKKINKLHLTIKIGLYIALSFIAMARVYHFSQKYQIDRTLKRYQQVNSLEMKFA